MAGIQPAIFFETIKESNLHIFAYNNFWCRF